MEHTVARAPDIAAVISRCPTAVLCLRRSGSSPGRPGRAAPASDLRSRVARSCRTGLLYQTASPLGVAATLAAMVAAFAVANCRAIGARATHARLERMA